MEGKGGEMCVLSRYHACSTLYKVCRNVVKEGVGEAGFEAALYSKLGFNVHIPPFFSLKCGVA